MKFIFFILTTFVSATSYAQDFGTYKDTMNGFRIDVPLEWKYGVPKESSTIKFLAYRTPASATDTARDSYNLNIIASWDKDLGSAFSFFIKSIQTANNFHLVDSGEVVIHGRNFKWLIESHTNQQAPVEMRNYDFFTLHNHKIYILTCATFSSHFAAIQPLFLRVAGSLQLK
jgi:hypothetical protein